MQITQIGLLCEAEFQESANWSERPQHSDISLVVIHCISLPEGEFGNKLPHRLFLNELPFNDYPELEELRGVQVSSHLLIERTGEITQFVPFTKQAWHAGLSQNQYRHQCNGYSIGIELEGTADTEFTHRQYVALVGVLRALFETYPSLSYSSLVGHNEVSPDRKIDPGKTFSWRTLYADLLTT